MSKTTFWLYAYRLFENQMCSFTTDIDMLKGWRNACHVQFFGRRRNAAEQGTEPQMIHYNRTVAQNECESKLQLQTSLSG